MSKLLIVESPGKVKKIQGFLGSGFKVMASVGHFRDLPKNKFGVEAPKYIPQYEITKGDVVKRLRAAAKECSEVILATDLDREGEAIAWHLQQVLKIKDPKRIVYNEISKKSILAALDQARKIDMPLVMAQEGRRVIDRLVGYRVSGPLSKIVGRKSSAGRVQTPAVVLVVNREREIANFKSVGHFGVIAAFETSGRQWTAIWNFKPFLNKDEGYWLDEAFAKKVAAESKSFAITDIKKSQHKQPPPAPFITSTLQQTASTALKFKPKRTMELAQKLYEAGLITYHRTDSPNLSEEAITAIWAELKKAGLNNYIPAAANTWKSKGDAQEAHECIRPTHLDERNPECSSEEAQLYNLIWHRTMASQMKPKLSDITNVTLLTTQTIASGDGRINSQQEFNAKGQVVTFDGWTRIYQDEDAKDKDEQCLPELVQGQQLYPVSVSVQNKKTQPPARYTEASLIKKLEDEGIGRPSTYASIIETLYRREYIEEEKRKLRATNAAETIIDALVGKFEFAQLGYTRQVEKHLDLIAHGKASYRELVAGVDQQLMSELQKLGIGNNNSDSLLSKDNPCPAEKCSGYLQKRPGKNGSFWGCSNYPGCTMTLPDQNGMPGERKKQTQTGKCSPCPSCGKDMILRQGKNGEFWACTGYPECKTSLPDDNGKPAQIRPCPECGKPLRRLLAKKGPNAGGYFWSCSGFPKCEKTLNDHAGEPVLS
jgi:DNA topoisomerase-1